MKTPSALEGIATVHTPVMSHAEYAGAELLVTPQRPDLGIHHVSANQSVQQVTTEDVPWLNHDMEAVLRKVYFIGGGSVLYGSIVNGNHTLVKLARNVCPERSKQAEAALFTSLPDWLQGRDMPDIDRVAYCAGSLSLYKAGRGRRDPARLFFLRTNDAAGTPVVLKAAVSRHKDQRKTMQLLTTLRPSASRGTFNG